VGTPIAAVNKLARAKPIMLNTRNFLLLRIIDEFALIASLFSKNLLADSA
jgi:hypothetical protein